MELKHQLTALHNDAARFNRKCLVRLLYFSQEKNGETSLLLLKRRRDEDYPEIWDFPGGSVEAGETLVQAMIRETSEETGIALLADHISFLGYSDFIDNLQHCREFLFICIGRRQKISLSEHVDSTWLPYSKFQDFLLHQPLKEFVLKHSSRIAEFLKESFLRNIRE